MYDRIHKLLTALFDETGTPPIALAADQVENAADPHVDQNDARSDGSPPPQARQVEAGANIGVPDAHEQALLMLLHLEQEAALELPPVAADFDFSYLQPPVHKAWVIELGRMIVKLTDQVLKPLPPMQPAYLKSTDEAPFFALAIEEAAEVKVHIQGRAAAADPLCTIQVGVETATRAWPRLGGIPVTLATATGAAQTQLTDAFGRVQFPAVTRALLPTATISIGPLAELQANAAID